MSYKGFKHTQETKQKMSLAKKGRSGPKHSEETKRKIAKAHRGRKIGPLSSDHKRKLSESLKGRKFTEEHKRKIGRKSKGRKHTSESKQKLRECSLKQWADPEQLKKISGENHYNWNGGRRTKGSGYVVLSGVYGHRLVMEKMIGRKLRTGEIVHHKDGNKKNNHSENLKLFASDNDHKQWHKENRGIKL